MSRPKTQGRRWDCSLMSPWARVLGNSPCFDNVIFQLRAVYRSATAALSQAGMRCVRFVSFRGFRFWLFMRLQNAYQGDLPRMWLRLGVQR